MSFFGDRGDSAGLAVFAGFAGLAATAAFDEAEDEAIGCSSAASSGGRAFGGLAPSLMR